MAEVVVLGDANVDVIAHFAKFPTPGRDAFATSTELHCGGSAANMAMALARLGVETLLVARVGADPWARTVIDSLAAAGVGLSGLQHDPRAMTGLMYVIVLPDGERTILAHRGANTRTDPNILPLAALRAARVVHLSGYALLAEPQRSAMLLALKLARQEGATVALDPGMSGHTAVELMGDLLPEIDVLFPNLAEARRLTGRSVAEDCARALLDAGVGMVALKLGKAGCLVCSQDCCHRIPGFAIAVRDTTGAGDGFDAGFIAGFLRGLDLVGAAVLGNAMGAVIAASVGADPVSLTADKVAEVLRTGYHDLDAAPYRPSIDAVIEALGAA
jgi:ribokinase